MSAVMPNFRRIDSSTAKVDASIAMRNGPVTTVPTPIASADDGVILIQGSTLKPEPVDWLWSQWLALGKVQVLAGPPGQGKTTIALACAATVSAGGQWPDGSTSTTGNVLIWSGEDDPKDTLLPRLLAMGADVSRVYFIHGTNIAGKPAPFDPARHLVQLAAQAQAIGDVRLLIVDPVVSAVAGDSHNNGDVRRGLQPLVDLASVLDAAVLGISHFTKGTTGRDPVERVTGSLAFGALPRVVLCAVKVKGAEGDEGRRILARAKSNNGPDDGGFEYSIRQTALAAHPGISASVILWGKALSGTARELLADAEAETDSDGDSAADLEAFIRSCLANGPVSARAFKADAEGAGYHWRNVQRAAKRLGAESRKEGMQGGWRWGFHPTPKATNAAEGAEGDRNLSVSPSSPSLSSSDDPEEF